MTANELNEERIWIEKEFDNFRIMMYEQVKCPPTRMEVWFGQIVTYLKVQWVKHFRKNPEIWRL